MIIEALLNGIRYVLRGVIAIFPTIPAFEFGSLDGVFQALSLTNLIIDIRVLALCFGVLFVFSFIELIWGVIMWVVRKLPGVE